MQMDPRKQKILEAVVLDYIETAEPVGSRTISKKYNLGVSSATIRNEMADLEEMGLIEQPHTSAGRIPSDAGYRYYVDYLMNKRTIEEEAAAFIGYKVHDKRRQVEELVRDTLKMLSETTNCTTVMMFADEHKKSLLKMVQLILVEPGKALMVIMTEDEQIENQFLTIPSTMTKDDLDLVSRMINQNLRGLPVENWQKDMLENIFQDLNHQRQVVDQALTMLAKILDIHPRDKKIYLDGGLNMLSQPEFKDVTKVKSLLKSLEQEEILSRIMDNELETGISVKIGSENELDEVKDCSVIVASYKVKGETVGKVGLIGPTRMDYSNAVSMLDMLTKALEEAFDNEANS